LSEFGSPTPYLGSRLKELQSFYQSPQYEVLRKKVESGCGIVMTDLFDDKGVLKKKDDAGKTAKSDESISMKIPTAKGITCRCPKCQTKLTVQVKKIPENKVVKISCPSCKNLFQLDVTRVAEAIPQNDGGKTRDTIDKKEQKVAASKSRDVSGASPGPAKETVESKKVKTVKGKCPKCGAAFSMALDKIAAKSAVELQCNSCKNKFRLILPQFKEDVSQVSPTEDEPL